MREHIRTSFAYIRRAPFQAMAAISVLSLTFFVMTLLAVMSYSTHQILRYFETRPQVIAFLKDEAGGEEVGKLKASLEGDVRVKDVVYVSKEEALEIYKSATSDNPLLGELVSPSIFPASIEFSVTGLEDTQKIIDEVSKNEVVESVDFTANIGGKASLSEVVNRLRTVTYYLRLGGLVTVVVLSTASLLVLTVVIGMRITMKRSEIESLSLIGATSWFIRAPIVLEAINYAVVGVIAGWLVAAVLLMYITPSAIEYFGEVPILPRASGSFFGLLAAILGVELVVGLVIALVGSLAAVSRSLRAVK